MTLTPRTERAHSVLSLFDREFPSMIPRSCSFDELASRVAHLEGRSRFDPNAPIDPVDLFLRNVERIQVGGVDQVLIRNPEIISKGSHKEVYGGVISTATKIAQVVAICLTKERPKGEIDFNMRELSFLRTAASKPVPGCVPVFGVKEISAPEGIATQFEAVFPLCTTDLFGIIGNQELLRTLSRLTIQSLQEKIVESVVQFHGEWIHRDIKPENFLLHVTPPNELASLPLLSGDVLNHRHTDIKVYLCDFGFVQNKQEVIPLKRQPGSRYYISPESAYVYMENDRIKTLNPTSELLVINATEKMDIWSLGLVLLAMENYSQFKKIFSVKKEKPIRDIRDFLAPSDQYYRAKSIPKFPEPLDKTSKIHLIWEMLRPRPEDRPTASEVLGKLKKLGREESVPPS